MSSLTVVEPDRLGEDGRIKCASLAIVGIENIHLGHWSSHGKTYHFSPNQTELGFRSKTADRFLGPQISSDEDEAKRKFNHFNQTNNFHVEHFSIQGCLKGRIARVK